ncbi:MAG: aldo/keto reductase [Polyangiaceae bacterium]
MNKPVFRLGLALNYGIDASGVERALEAGMNYLYYTAMRTSHTLPVLKKAFAARRDNMVVATGPMMGFFEGNVRRGAESILRKLGTDYIDVFLLPWLGVGSSFRPAVVDAMVKLRDEGKVKAIGVSIHDRERAGRLAEDSVLDLLMIRYNAAHPGAERDIFPHLARRQPNVVAYTATSWRKLLRAPSGWDGPVMSAGDCYRFCLSSPSVDLVLTGPKNAEELDANLRALDKGPLTAEEDAWIRRFGHAVHG